MKSKQHTSRRNFSSPLIQEKDRIFKRNLLSVIVISLAVIISYSSCINNDFTNWDDPEYVLNNAVIKNLSISNLKEIFTSYYQGNFHPVTILSYAIEYSIFKLNAKVYHLDNLLLHVFNTCLVFYFIQLLAGKIEISILCAILFGVHPLQVESVSWISERKNVLYSFFYLGSLICYLKHISGTKSAYKKYLFYAWILFIFSLLSKALAVTLPVTLLIIDFYFKRKPYKNLIIEKIPFLLFSVITGLIAIKAQKSFGVVPDVELYSLGERTFFACFALVSYLVKILLPFNLSNFYPYPLNINGYYPNMVYIAPFIILLTGFTVWKTYKHTLNIVFGCLFFLINVFLVLQLLPVGMAIMADRYVYLPCIGIFFILAQGFYYIIYNSAIGIKRYATILTGILGVYLLLLSFLSYDRCNIWSNSLTLWTDAIKKNPQVAETYRMRGKYFYENNELENALMDYNKAIELRPNSYTAYKDRGTIYYQKSIFDKAIQDYNTALTLNPDWAEAYYDRGIAYLKSENYNSALADFNKALLLKPQLHFVYINKGVVFIQTKQYHLAINELNKAIQINPQVQDAYYNRGMAYYYNGNYKEAINDFSYVLKMYPQNAAALFNRSITYHAVKEYKKAFADAVGAKTIGYPVENGYLEQLKNLTHNN